MKKLLLILGILILSMLTSCIDKEGEPTVNLEEIGLEYFEIDYSTVSEENGYEYIDLGLSVKWAICNLGAITPDKLGDFYAWGEAYPKRRYVKDNYIWYDKNFEDSRNQITKYDCGYKPYGYDGRSILELKDDAANYVMGGNWRMPTSKELNELVHNCTWVYGAVRTSSSAQKKYQLGYKVTSRINGKSIFIPVSGAYQEHWSAKQEAKLWSCQKNDTCTYRFDDRDEFNAYSLYVNKDSVSVVEQSRCIGLAIRPVLASTLNYTATFDNNGAEGNMSALNFRHGDLFIVPESTYKCRGFVSWNTKSDTSGRTYYVDDRFSISSDVELYAQWVRLSCDAWSDANGREYVDLGLSVKWATCNLGASSPEEIGDYYAWGEVVPKETYSWSTYKWCRGTKYEITKYFSKYFSEYEASICDKKLVLDFEDDAARVNLGGSWAMPSYDEVKELVDNCTYTVTQRNGVDGLEFVSNINGNSIFLPFTGHKSDSSLEDVFEGFYWTNAIQDYNPIYIDILYISRGRVSPKSGEPIYGYWRPIGMTIRPVLL